MHHNDACDSDCHVCLCICMHVCKYTRLHLGGQSTGDTADTLHVTHFIIYSNYQCVISLDTESLAFQDKIDS